MPAGSDADAAVRRRRGKMTRVKKLQATIRRQLNAMKVYAHNEEVANEQAALATEMLNDVQSEAYKLRTEREEWQKYIKRISDMYDASEAVRQRQAAEIAELRQYKEMYEGLCR